MESSIGQRRMATKDDKLTVKLVGVNTLPKTEYDAIVKFMKDSEKYGFDPNITYSPTKPIIFAEGSNVISRHVVVRIGPYEVKNVFMDVIFEPTTPLI